MKIYGDVTDEERKLADELTEMEYFFHNQPFSVYSRRLQAKVFISLAHDWFTLSMDDEGTRLIDKAIEVCPEYLQTFVIDDIAKDPKFKKVMERIYFELSLLLVELSDNI